MKFGNLHGLIIIRFILGWVWVGVWVWGGREGGVGGEDEGEDV